MPFSKNSSVTRILRAGLILLGCLALTSPLRAQVVTTLPATGVSNTVATLNGTVNPGGLATTAWFEWGLSPFYNTTITGPVAVGSGSTPVAISNLVIGLMPGLVYHCRVVASNALGVVRGNDVSFGSPTIALNGGAVLTNECHAAFNEPGATATGAPLAIAGGALHSLALKRDGTVAAWGVGTDNSSSVYNYGQSIIPVGLSNVAAIAGGSYHSLALKSDGTVAAWGAGLVNDGSSSVNYGQSIIPVGLSNVVAIAGGGYHSLALRSDGTVVAWGYNGYGQTNIPVGLSNVVAVAAGAHHNLALKRDGKVVAWGAGLTNSNPSDYVNFGQSIIPTGLSNVVAIAAGYSHSLAVKSDGTVAAWGLNGFGQTTVPAGLSNVVAIAGGFVHSLALQSGGTVAAWGVGITIGAYDVVNRGQSIVPLGLSNVVAIAGGGYHSLALQSDGTVAAWGNNLDGETTVPGNLTNLTVTVSGSVNTNAPGIYPLTYSVSNACGCSGAATRTVVVQDTHAPVITLLGGDPLTNQVNVPFVDPGAIAFDVCAGSVSVSTNSTVNVAVLGNYVVTYTCTDDYGNSATNTRLVVVANLPPLAITLAATGVSNTVATLNGTVNPGGLATTAWFEWGLSPFSNTNTTAPVAVGSGSTTVAVSNLLADLTPGHIYYYRVVASNLLGVVFGDSVPSSLLALFGAATVTNECHAAFVDPGANAVGAPVAIAGGYGLSVVLKSDGTVAVWGYYPGFGRSPIPEGLSNVVAIAGGVSHSLALKSDGTVVGWGDNTYGETNPLDSSNVVAIAGGYFHSLALKRDGTVFAWGYNDQYQTTIPPGLSNVVAIAGGEFYSLALKSDGTVAAWGYNGHGETNIPVGLSNVVAIATGAHHSLALQNDGTVAAWGFNYFGQTDVPVGLNNVVAIAGGDSHSLALKGDGTVVVWGYNAYGQTNVPVGLSNVVAIAGGDYHSLALKRDGTIVGWGLNNYGQTTFPAGLNNYAVSGSVDTNTPGAYLLTYSASNAHGGGNTATRTVVVHDTTPPVVTLLGSNPLTNEVNVPFVDPGATASDACAGFVSISTTSTVDVSVLGTYTVTYTSTDNFGNSATNTRTVVVTNIPPSVATSIASGVSNSVAILNGTVNPGGLATSSWFEWEIPYGLTNTTAPLPVGSGSTSVALSNLLTGLTQGVFYRCRIVASNSLGVARGHDVLFSSPALTLNGAAILTNECHAVVDDPGATAFAPPLTVAGGGYHSLALKSDGTIVSWGWNCCGQTDVPAGMNNVVAISGGGYHSLALKSDGSVVAWGRNVNGQTTLPPGLTNVVAIAGGDEHSLVLKLDGTVSAWGWNGNSQTTLPVGLTNVVAIAAGYVHSLALMSNGTVAAWGDNSYGETTIPAGLSSVVAIAGGDGQSLALKSDGAIVAWGRNNLGQSTVPAGLSNVVAVAAGGYHSLALKRDGTVAAWGDDTFRQTSIPEGLSNVVAIAGGFYHSLALQNDGTVVAWGYDGYGQTDVPVGVDNLGVTVSGDVDTNTPGTYSLRYSAGNALGGSATATRTVVVQDTTPPVITLVGNNPLMILTNSPFIDPGATAFDVCAGGVGLSTNNPVDMSVPGTYTITYTASDGNGHSTTNTRTVLVQFSTTNQTALSSPTRTGDGLLQLSFSNFSGASLTVFGSSDLSLPLGSWANLGTALEVPLGSGRFQFIDTDATNKSQRFYIIRSP